MGVVNSRVTVVNLDVFLRKLHKALTKWSEAVLSPSKSIPAWAASYTDILYSTKSIPPPVFSEPDKLYISYHSDHANESIKLIGKTKDDKVINRTLGIKKSDLGRKITLTSMHRDFITAKTFTCIGEGQTFEKALNNYFLCCDLKKSGYSCKTNIQKDGDAFLFPKILSAKGDKFLVDEIIAAVRKLITLVPENKHDAVLLVIQKNMDDFERFLETRECKEIVNYYDARLWIIVESVCKYFDPLTEENDTQIQRKALRDHLIAECCSKLMKGMDIIQGLEAYFNAMKMQNDILAMSQEKKLDSRIKNFIQQYEEERLYPEIEADRVKIRGYHEKCCRA